jgi:hypothetical protein
MSSVLEAILGQAYQPDSHWTSHHRVKAGYAAYSPGNTTRASFTVLDKTGRLAEYLAHRGYRNAAQWTKSRIVYHIEVKATEDGLDSPFEITNEELDRVSVPPCLTAVTSGFFVSLRMKLMALPLSFKAMTFSHTRSEARVPDHVCIWVRMGNVKNMAGASVQFMVDPWHMWTMKELAVKSVGGFLGLI